MMYDSSDRGLALMALAAAMTVALCFAALAPAMAADQPRRPRQRCRTRQRRLPRGGGEGGRSVCGAWGSGGFGVVEG